MLVAKLHDGTGILRQDMQKEMAETGERYGKHSADAIRMLAMKKVSKLHAFGCCNCNDQFEALPH